MENHRFSGENSLSSGGSFHSYVKLPEGMFRGFQQIRFFGEKKSELVCYKNRSKI
jgi:hypothetical protein